LQDLIRRFLPPVAIALAITALLFLLMKGLISNEQPRLDERPMGANLTFVPLIEDQPVKGTDHQKPKRTIIEAPVDQPITPGPDGTPIDTTVQITPRPPTTDGIGIADGNFLPIVTVAPEYPRRMASRGIEGWVLLAFTVDELGRVVDPRVVEAQPQSGFNKAALNAITRFKFKPQVVNGTAIAVVGVQQRIVFQLGES
ncbi:MAG: energy transducer TonB, partial [Pseudomonadales bacterium]